MLQPANNQTVLVYQAYKQPMLRSSPRLNQDLMSTAINSISQCEHTVALANTTWFFVCTCLPKNSANNSIQSVRNSFLNVTITACMTLEQGDQAT